MGTIIPIISFHQIPRPCDDYMIFIFVKNKQKNKSEIQTKSFVGELENLLFFFCPPIEAIKWQKERNANSIKATARISIKINFWRALASRHPPSQLFSVSTPLCIRDWLCAVLNKRIRNIPPAAGRVLKKEGKRVEGCQTRVQTTPQSLTY